LSLLPTAILTHPHCGKLEHPTPCAGVFIPTGIYYMVFR